VNLSSFLELILVFGRMGLTGFGGPLALIALMEEECCKRRGWVSLEEFQETFVICKLFPGPIAYQMAVWLGATRGGRLGGVVAGVSFLIPGLTLILLAAHFYAKFQGANSFNVVLEGMRAGALVLIFDSLYRMAEPYKGEVSAWFLAALAVVLMLLFPAWEPLIIIMGGLSMVLASRVNYFRARSLSVPALSLLFQIFWVHFKAGAFVFGTGLAIIPFLQNETVLAHQWLTESEFMDGIAFGQVTPGPVTITSAFIGWKAAGLLGAVAGMVGMYLPGIFLVLAFLPLVKRQFKRWAWLTDFQKGALPVVIGCILGATLSLSKAVVTDFQMLLIMIVLLVFSRFVKIPGWLYMPLGSALRLVLR
jgi:chromate transporter